MRERPADGDNPDRGIGITPARAGKTGRWLSLPAMYRDHPRSCGKDVNNNLYALNGTGSPPLVRERRNLYVQNNRKDGITPARAGKTHQFCQPNRAVEDHPRSCGKDIRFNSALASFSGSPPLVRERPAPPFPVPGVVRDHPRSCGKDRSFPLYFVSTSGSPPLVRERRPSKHARQPENRITPARAGKTGTLLQIQFIN